MELGRPEIEGRPARSDATEVFAVIARAERPLRRAQLPGRLRERGIVMERERIEAALAELVRRGMVRMGGTVMPRARWMPDEEKGWWD